jgi:CHASE3 domain sensor protein
MTRNWTFGRKIAVSFAAVVLVIIALGAVAVYALRDAVASKDRVINMDAQILLDMQTLRIAIERRGSAGRAFFLTADEQFINQMRESNNAALNQLARLRQNADTDAVQLDAIERTAREHQAALDQVVALRRMNVPIETVARAFDSQVVPRRDQLDREMQMLSDAVQARLQRAKQASTDAASDAMRLIIGMAAVGLIFALGAAFVLTRGLGRNIGAAVSQVQSSSAELQAAANQQAIGAKEQASAMSEISTTISELLATSRQISESGQRVAHIAGQTLSGARMGEGIVHEAHESITGIRRQVDLIVSHMLDLGKKSQHIGTVLDIVSELAEQTNILAINASIEAVGAGDAGKRFGVVADEIRKLADRVAASTKEIRNLIEDVRSAVNTTVMTTETGAKAVDAGAKQFGEVTTSFKNIADLVGTATEAAKEIELSTKQQTSAVEQVNLAIGSVAQATREAEASSGETLQTASQLATLSKELLRLVRPPTDSGNGARSL